MASSGDLGSFHNVLRQTRRVTTTVSLSLREAVLSGDARIDTGCYETSI